ncbi:hypothetical protein LIER_31514 [Lithospermum erythrorhizon]|uniref:Reverse transcriptase n=1 Tax=Lithospermum erythrorhizon TaxID=34254 RepID=A0AAV3RX52_LITER
MRILQDYETTSGQKVNVGKSLVSFEPQVTPAIRAQIVCTLKMREVCDQRKYLGLPSYIGRSKKAVFNYLVAEVEGSIRGWKGKLLSQAGRGIEESATVSLLIQNGVWLENKVKCLFTAEDAVKILTIPLSKHHIRDKLVWSYSNCGIYLTISGYKSARTLKGNGGLCKMVMGESSNHGGELELWKNV